MERIKASSHTRGGSCVPIPEHSSPIPANAPTRSLSRSLSVAHTRGRFFFVRGSFDHRLIMHLWRMTMQNNIKYEAQRNIKCL